MFVKKVILFLLLINISCAKTAGDYITTREANNGIKNHHLGLMIAHSLNENVINRTYFNRPYYVYSTLFKMQYGYRLYAPVRSVFLKLLLEPQFNVAKYSREGRINGLKRTFELGLSIGLMIVFNVFRYIDLYALASVGPHYVYKTPYYQDKGFIFNDNLGAGIAARIYNNISMEFRFGWRHLSNAGLKRPNGGIEHIVLGYGAYYSF